MEEITLTEDQQNAIDSILAWRGPRISVGGYAGSGKTTLIKELLRFKRFSDWAVASFTGKAVEVLRSKGIDRAQTIHNLMYQVSVNHKTKDVNFHRSDYIDRTGVIVDEASMVDMELYRDLTKYNIPIIWVGDMGQLEPIGDDPRLMHKPDITLTQIHRQALESPIIRLSMLIREDAPLEQWFETADDQQLSIRRQKKATYDRMVEFAAREGTLTICGFNRTRFGINEDARSLRGYTEKLCKGDKVICVSNERSQDVFNGMVGVVSEDPEYLGGTTYEAQITINGEEKARHLKCDFGPALDKRFDKKAWLYEAMARRKDAGCNDLTLWDYAYAVTCHKAQGSEADEVAVWGQQCEAWDPIRWRYTAATRARNRLVYCV